MLDGINHSHGKGGAKLGGNSRTERAVVIGESRYKAAVYGRRMTMTTKMDIPLQGIVIDDTMAVDESPARVLDKEASKAEIGGREMSFSSEAEMDNFIAEQIEWEAKIGPVRPKTKLGNETLAPESVTNAWTEGAKTLLVIRVDFPDKPGEPLDDNRTGQPLTVARAQNLYNEVNTFFVNNSYGKTSIQTTVVPVVVHLSQPQTYYTQASDQTLMIADARNAARQRTGYLQSSGTNRTFQTGSSSCSDGRKECL